MTTWFRSLPSEMWLEAEVMLGESDWRVRIVADPSSPLVLSYEEVVSVVEVGDAGVDGRHVEIVLADRQLVELFAPDGTVNALVSRLSHSVSGAEKRRMTPRAVLFLAVTVVLALAISGMFLALRRDLPSTQDQTRPDSSDSRTDAVRDVTEAKEEIPDYGDQLEQCRARAEAAIDEVSRLILTVQEYLATGSDLEMRSQRYSAEAAIEDSEEYCERVLRDCPEAVAHVVEIMNNNMEQFFNVLEMLAGQPRRELDPLYLPNELVCEP